MNEEMTKCEADDLLVKIAQCEAAIKAAENEREEFTAHYQQKIFKAAELCEAKCKPLRQEIACHVEMLRRYAQENIPGGRKSLEMPSGKIFFSKRYPKFYDADEREITNKSKPLMAIVKEHFPQFVKVTQEESVAWGDFKKCLAIDGEQVYFAETGEVIEGLHAQTFPDEFGYKLG